MYNGYTKITLTHIIMSRRLIPPLYILIGLLVAGGLVTLFGVLYFAGDSSQEEIISDEPSYLDTMERGQADPAFEVINYDPDQAYNSTTLIVDKTQEIPRILEVNMLGEIMWEYQNPEWRGGVVDDVEWLPETDTFVFIYHFQGDFLHEIDRAGNILFEYKDSADHDIDKLGNGNYLYVYGMDDTLDDAIVKEVTPQGEIVWEWYVKDHLAPEIYEGVENEGVAHTNGVVRLENGNTLISTRNFDSIVEVDPNGEVVRVICEGVCAHQHDPEMLENGNILMANQTTHGSDYELGDEPQRALEIDSNTGETIWEFLIAGRRHYPLRDADRLPNGNTLITGSDMILEVTPDGEIVWQLNIVPEITFHEAFYNAQRI